VKKRGVKDIAASVRARLLANAKETGRPFQEILHYFEMERFLFRLSIFDYFGWQAGLWCWANRANARSGSRGKRWR
jgi:hypothetical protein